MTKRIIGQEKAADRQATITIYYRYSSNDQKAHSIMRQNLAKEDIKYYLTEAPNRLDGTMLNKAIEFLRNSKRGAE